MKLRWLSAGVALALSLAPGQAGVTFTPNSGRFVGGTGWWTAWPDAPREPFLCRGPLDIALDQIPAGDPDASIVDPPMRAAFIFARNRTAAGRHGELLAEGTCARPDRPIGPDEPEVLELFVVSRNVHASYDMTTVFQTMFACSQRQGCVFEIPASVYGSGPVVSIQQRRDEAGHLDVAFEGFGMLHIYYPPELNRTCPCENHTFQPSSGIRDILGHVGPVVGGHEGGSPKPDNPSPKP